MTLPLATAGLLQGAAVLAAASSAAAVLVVQDPRRRAVAMGVALLASGLGLATLVGATIVEEASARPALALAGAGVASIAVGTVALIIRRWPAALALLAVGALPFRLPVAIGADSANLLLPLYGVIAAGVIAHLAGWVPGRDDEGRSGRRLVVLERALAAVIVLYALQSLYSDDPERAVKNVCFFYGPFAVLFALLARMRWSVRLARASFAVVVVLALACAAVGFVEYATGHLLIPNPKVLAANELKPYFRVNSLFFDPNIYGRFLVVAMVPLAALLLWTRRRRSVWLMVGTLAVLWAGLVLSLSQSSFAALLGGLVVVAALRWRPGPVVAAAAAAGLAAAAVLILAPASVGISGGSERAVNRATSGRLDLLRTGAEMARDNPVLGVGSGGFATEYRRRERVWAPTAAAESHTIPLTIAAEQGAIGLTGYLVLMAAALALVFAGVRRAVRHGDPAEAVVRVAVAAAFCALTVHTLAYAAFLEDPMVWTVLAMAAATAGWRRPAS